MLAFTIGPVCAFKTEGVWKLEHLYSQKISVGLVSDLYPSEPAWSAEMLIFGIQFLNQHMAFLHCETASGAQTVDYKVFYSIEQSRQKSQVTFTLERGDEIVLSLFSTGDGTTVFSYCDAGPQPGEKSDIYESTNKIVFRNHFGTIKRIDE